MQKCLSFYFMTEMSLNYFHVQNSDIIFIPKVPHLNFHIQNSQHLFACAKFPSIISMLKIPEMYFNVENAPYFYVLLIAQLC